MQNDRLDETQAGIKIARRNINNLRYADDTTPKAENKEELKSLLMKMKESEKIYLKLSIQETKIMASGPITSWQTDGKQWEPVRDFAFCHKGDIICISDVIDISPGSLVFSLCFIQSNVSHDVLGI